MRSFAPAASTFLVILGLLVLLLPAEAATSSGLDTVGGNQIFAVEGTKVGEWSPSQLSVTGGFAASGAVQVGQTTIACTPANGGALRYKNTSKQIEFCNGTEWQEIGGPQGSMCGHFLCDAIGYSYANGGFTVYSGRLRVSHSCLGISGYKGKISYNGEVGGETTFLQSCPSGYTLIPLSGYTDSISDLCLTGVNCPYYGADDPRSCAAGGYTCIKN